MRQHILAFACLCSATALLVSAVPLPASSNQELDVLQIPLSNDKELDVLTLGAKDQEQLIAERNKRTIGLLRDLFPDLTKQIDSIVNRIIAQVIRVAGPSLLPTLLGNNNRPTTPRSSFDADFEDDDEDTDSNDDALSTNSVSDRSVTGGTRVQVDLPTFAPDTETISTTTTEAAETKK